MLGHTVPCCKLDNNTLSLDSTATCCEQPALPLFPVPRCSPINPLSKGDPLRKSRGAKYKTWAGAFVKCTFKTALQSHVKQNQPRSKVPLLHLCCESPQYRSLIMRFQMLLWDPLSACYKMTLASYIFHLFECVWFGASKSKVIFVYPALPSIFRD